MPHVISKRALGLINVLGGSLEKDIICIFYTELVAELELFL